MESRHSLSEPRIKSNSSDDAPLLLRWEVDIYREGVPDPIETLEISDETLPPRVNKKGKIVWRLPTEEGRLPSFGTDEKRRIMDLYKEKKKNRKKKLMLPNESSANGMDDKSNEVSDTPAGSSPNKEKNKEEKNFPDTDEYNLSREQRSTESHNHVEQKIVESTAVNSSSKSKKKKTKDKSLKKLASSDTISSATSPEGKTCAINDCNDSIEVDNTNIEPKVATNANLRFPPGLERPNSAQSPTQLESSSIDEIKHHISDLNNIDTSPPSLSTPISRYFTIPEKERFNIRSATDIYPPSLPQTSYAVSAAKAFVDLYYPLITHGLSNDLALYYTLHAQKSVSVGGAHSVVASRPDIILQLSSLAGSLFVVRGVVAQDTHDSRGVHILVTGIVQTSARAGSNNVTPFAHSVCLAPVRHNSNGQGSFTGSEIPQQGDYIPFAFQIHNDALSILTMGDMMSLSNEQQQLHQSQTQGPDQERARGNDGVQSPQLSNKEDSLNKVRLPPGLF